jgi:hypothetical protein
LTLGEVAGAIGDAEQCVAYADRSGDAFERQSDREALADALHQAGHRDDAQARFREAEAMQAKYQPEYPLLYSLRGFQYCDPLLGAPERAAWQIILRSAAVSERPAAAASPGQHAPNILARVSAFKPAAGGPADTPALLDSCLSVERRAAQTLKWDEQTNLSLLTIALDHLTLGRVALYAAILEGSSLVTCHSSLDQAVSGLRRAGDTTLLPLGLLTRAWLRFMEGDPEESGRDLDEAWQIAERGPMRLHMADIHLHRARLFGRQKEEGGSIRGPALRAISRPHASSSNPAATGAEKGNSKKPRKPCSRSSPSCI